MIENIRLVDFKNHIDSEYVFSSGINAIVGPGGCGKTSIIEAIGWSVFGTLPGKKDSFERLDSVSDSDSGFVEIEFGNYQITKGFDLPSTMFTENMDRVIAEGEMDVRQTVGEILGSNMLDVIFSGIIGITQGSIDGIFSKSTSERVKHFSRIIGVDEYKKCAEWLIHVQHELVKNYNVLMTKYSRMEEDVELRTEDECALFLFEKDLLEIESEIDELSVEVQELSSILEGIVIRNVKISSAKADLKKTFTRIYEDDSERALQLMSENFCPECGQQFHESSEVKFALMDKYIDMRNKNLMEIVEKSNLEDAIERLEDSANAVDSASIETTHEAKSDHLENLLVEKNMLEGKTSIMKDRLLSDGVGQSKLSAMKKSLESADDARRKLEVIRKVCRKVPIIISGSVTREVSVLATYFVDMICDNWKIEWNGDFSIDVNVGGMKLPFHSLSKSQKAIASLAVLLGLAKVVSPVDFILLDEPFSNMDANQVSRVANAIRSTGWFEQVILTTHRAEVEHIFDNVIEVSA